MQWTGDAGRLTDRPARPILLHPGDSLPHTDALGLPPWAQGVAVVLVVLFASWMVADAWAERRAAGVAGQAEKEPDEHRQSERLVRGGPGGRQVAADAGAEAVPSPPPVATEPGSQPRGQRMTVGRSTTATPPRLLLFALASIAGWLALDRARAVAEIAAFIGNDGTERMSTLAFAFAALWWVGGALALVAPRGAALAFALAGICGLALATAARWEERLEWWGPGPPRSNGAIWRGGRPPRSFSPSSPSSPGHGFCGPTRPNRGTSATLTSP